MYKMKLVPDVLSYKRRVRFDNKIKNHQLTKKCVKRQTQIAKPQLGIRTSKIPHHTKQGGAFYSMLGSLRRPHFSGAKFTN